MKTFSDKKLKFRYVAALSVPASLIGFLLHYIASSFYDYAWAKASVADILYGITIAIFPALIFGQLTYDWPPPLQYAFVACLNFIYYIIVNLIIFLLIRAKIALWVILTGLSVPLTYFASNMYAEKMDILGVFFLVIPALFFLSWPCILGLQLSRRSS